LELKKECRQLGLNASGNRNELLALLPPRTIENIKMPNGASDWTVDEYEKIVMKIVESTIHTEPTLFNVEEERRVGAYLMWLFMLFTFTMGVLKMCGVSESA
jgi:hypothetical protein